MDRGPRKPPGARRQGSATGQQLVRSAARALAIVKLVAGSANGLTAREISEGLDLSRPTTYHLLHTLVDEGFLTPGDERHYRLGSAISSIADGLRRQLAPPEHLVPHLRSLSLATGEAAYIGGWSGDEIMILARMPGQHLVSVTESPLGLVGNAHARATGKLFLAHASADVRSEYLRRHPPRRLTPSTLIRRKELEQEFTTIRNCGYAVDIEEFAEGVCCLAAPVGAAGGEFVMAISAPKQRFLEHFDMYLEATLGAVSAASGTPYIQPAEATTGRP